MLPTCCVDDNITKYKVFFLGYMVHKLLMCSLGRLEEDDRDHYGERCLVHCYVKCGPVESDYARAVLVLICRWCMYFAV